MGVNDPSKIYIVDFGLAKYYLEPKAPPPGDEPASKEEKKKNPLPRTEHIPQCDGKSLVGTPRYASLHSHMGQEQSRRDDLETLCYMLTYLFNGKLPWSGLKADSKELKYINIKKTKESISPEELCKGMP